MKLGGNKMNESRLRNYARLIARVGLNVQKGQDVMLTTTIEQASFNHMLLEELYDAGARKVFITYEDPVVSRLEYEKATDLDKLETFEEEKWKYIADHHACRLFIESQDPDALAGLDASKISSIDNARRKIIKKYRDQFENKVQWCIAGAPSLKWAKKVFPELSDEEAIEKLWENILKASRAFEGDPIRNWEEHALNLKEKSSWLNSLQLVKLKYSSKNGTDFEVSLNPDILFLGGEEKRVDEDIVFEPNIPSEEIFTSPIAGRCEGKVVATKPLNLDGQLIDNFYIVFKDGKVVDLHAEKGEDALRHLINTDEGSRMLGECALIPYRSPINDLGIVFYSTLFDENCSCHLALGQGFSNLVRDFDKKSEEQIKASGINSSLIHCDFMIGSEDMNIIGTTKDGKEVPIFIQGNWAK